MRCTLNSSLEKKSKFLVKHYIYLGVYLIGLISIYFNFILFYKQIDNPIYSPLLALGPVIFTFINSVLFSLVFFVFKKINAGIFIYLFLLDIVLIVNTAYFHYFGNVIPIYSYGNISNMYELHSTLTSYLQLTDFIYFISTFVLLLLYFVIKREHKLKLNRKFRLFTAGILLLVCISFLGLNLIQDKIQKSSWDEKFFNINDNQPQFVSYYGILPLWIYQISSHIHSENTPITQQETTEIKLFQAQQNKLFADSSGNKSQKNLILIIVESLDSWTLDYDNGKATPFLNKLIQDSDVIFVRNVLPQVNHGRSSDAQLIFNTGLLPVFNNTVANMYSKQNYPSLAEALKETHTSLTIMGNNATFWNQKTMNISYHIDSLISIESLNKDEIIGMGISDKSVFRQSSRILSKIKKPFYCQIITLSSHDGIDFKNEPTNLSFPTNFTDDTKGYIKSIQYVDASIESFFDMLKKNNLYDNSVIIITGDHDGPNREIISKTFPNLLTNLEINNKIAFTPLFILNSGKKFHQKPHQVLGQIDLYPTMLSTLGINNYFWTGVGLSIFTDQAPQFAVSKQQQVVGDTLNHSPFYIQQRKNGWKISDLMIRKKYFNTKKTENERTD